MSVISNDHMLSLYTAIEFARIAHGDQKYGGQDYLCHLLRVALQCKSDFTRRCAILHDVVEDTPVTLDEIKDKFGLDVAYVVGLLTRGKEEDYDSYLSRIMKSSDAIEVKIADLRENIYHGEFVYHQYELRAREVYRPALARLLA